MSVSYDYISLTLVSIASLFITVLYFTYRSVALALFGTVWWFTTSIIWLLTTTWYEISFLFLGVGLVMLIYFFYEVFRLAREGRDPWEEYWNRVEV